ncbi:DUF3047 domain-containing protein [Leucothrix sargassi]|nr:DUF3047 domain-containing protein [Leucothrix sargassi]
MKTKLIIAAGLALSMSTAFAEGQRVNVSDFAGGSLKGWESKEFSGKTQYQIQHQGNRNVLTAKADAGASALGVRKRIDLTKTPFLNWSWRIDKAHPPLKEATKGGDDYAARVYVIIDGGVFVWKTRALNYVWSSRPDSRTQKWNNPFLPRNARMLAVRDSRNPQGQWLTEKQNVAADFKALYGFTPTYIDGVAIMTDADNTGGSVAASYGDIYFTEK